MNNNSPKLTANSYFFKELLASDQQNASQAFGPVTGNETTQYRFTSLFNTATDTRAFAICTGQVFLQPHTDSTKLNLILRPYKQPITGVPIKYFIYRGLKKTDFIPSGNTFLVGHSQLATATDFIQLIWNQLKAFNNWTDTQANNNNFRAEWIGYKPTHQPANSLIDDYFFAADAYGDENNETLKPFEFPLVSQGTFLGNFSGDYGLDIVLSNGDYKEGRSNTGFALDLAYARAAEAILDIANLPISYAEKQYREAIGQFMDAAAYYGLHYSKTSSVTAINGANVEKKKQQTLYDDIISQFATKNKVYLHIQGHLGRSYNFYGSYSAILENNDVVQQGTTLENLAVTTYLENGWPVIIQEASQSNTELANKILLQLVQNGEDSLIAHAQIGQFSDAAENNFLTESQLRPPPSTDGSGNIQTDNYCNPIELLVPAIGDSNSRNNVASYIKILYTGNTLTAVQYVDGTLVTQPIKPIDTLFGPVDARQRLASTTEEVISWSFSNSQQLVNVTEIVEDETTNLALQTKIVFDKLAFGDANSQEIQDRLVYESSMVQGLGQGVLNRGNAITSSTTSGNLPFSNDSNNFYLPQLPYFITTEPLTDGINLIKGLRLNQLNNQPINNFFLGVTLDQKDQIKQLVIDEGLTNSYFFLFPVAGSSHFISQEAKSFNKYRLMVCGEDATGNLNLKVPIASIFIYTLDYKYFFSSAFTQHMPSLFAPEVKNVLITNFKEY